jgi:hypothetical protein
VTSVVQHNPRLNPQCAAPRDLVITRGTLGERTGFFSHLYIYMIILPRQARDKHRENSKKARFVEGAPCSGTNGTKGE